MPAPSLPTATRQRLLGTLLLLPAALSAPAAAHAQTQGAFAPLTRAVHRDIDGQRAYRTVEYVQRFFRLPGNDGFDAAIDSVASLLRAAGYVREDSAPPSARLVYRIESRPMRDPAWTPLAASITLTGRATPLQQFATNMNMIAINSVSTPAGGVTARVVDVGAGSEADFARSAVRGQIVLTNGNARVVQQRAMQQGAAGVLATQQLPAYLQQDKNRRAIQFTGIARDSVNPGWLLFVSRASHDSLKAAMALGPLQLTVHISTRLERRPERTLVAEIRGASRPAERFVYSAHVQEPGANDNASGVGALAEMARVAANLVKRGVANPQRTVTFLWGDEIRSTDRFIKEDSTRRAGIKWGMSLDMVGENTATTGGTFLIEKMPDPSAVWVRGEDQHTEWGGRPLAEKDIRAHWFNDFVRQRCLDRARATGWVVKANPFEGGSDHTPFLNADIPAVLLWHFTDQFYHTDLDRIEHVSATTLGNVGACALTTGLLLADGSRAVTLAALSELTRVAEQTLRTQVALSRDTLTRGGTTAHEQHILEAWRDYYLAAIDRIPEIAVGPVNLVQPLTAAKARVRTAAVSLAPRTSGTGEEPAATVLARPLFGARWFPFTQVTRDNVAGLTVAWRASTGEAALPVAGTERFALEATPVVIDGIMYVSTPLGRVLALDAVTGAERWTYDPGLDQRLRFGDFTNRGVTVWIDPAARRGAPCARTVFSAVVDARVVALDAATGKPCASFGTAGIVDLRRGLRNAPAYIEEYELTSPPVVVNGVLVVGSAVADNGRIDAPSGEVRGYDARTGALRWTFDPVPQNPRDPAYGSWRGPNGHRAGAANAWSLLVADPARDLVFLPTASPSPDYYGGERLGENRYGNSLVALRASTGTVVWHRQTVHHDLWDYDNASPPALVTITRDGRAIPAVVQATKSGQLFVLHRETGAPLFPIEERAVPASTVAGEQASPTQPFSSLPPLGLQRLGEADVWGLTDADRDACRLEVRTLRNEGIFTPPSLEGTLVAPSNIGGAHWGGVAIDSVRQIVVVPVNRLAAVVQLLPRAYYDSLRAGGERGERLNGDWEYASMTGTPYGMRRRILRAPSGLPCTPPPFGALVAISLRSGERLWEVPLGTMRGVLPDDVIAALPNGGSPNLGGPIVTAGGIVFIGASIDRSLRAFDIETGKVLWQGELPAGAKATPITYQVSGRQYVTIAAGGGSLWGTGDAIVTFALPERK